MKPKPKVEKKGDSCFVIGLVFERLIFRVYGYIFHKFASSPFYITLASYHDSCIHYKPCGLLCLNELGD